MASVTRASCSGTISFGLISIPSKMYAVASPKSTSFNMITKKGNRVNQVLVDAFTKEPVERSETMKGYEVSKDKYVVFSEEEIKSLEGERSNDVTINEFVKGFEVLPHQVEKSYYVAPDKGGDKAYKLLVAALKKTNKVAVCKWRTRGKDHLVVLSVQNDSIMMNQMYYMDEIKEFKPIYQNQSEPSEKEMELAELLINKLTTKGDVDLSKYHDEFASRVEKAIETKVAGGKLEVPQEKATSAFDLESLLSSSLK